MSDDEDLNGHGRPAGEEGANAAPEGNDYGKGNSGGPGAPSGPANPNWKHGLYSQYLSPEDREIIEQIDGEDAAEKLEMLIDINITRLLRAAEILDEPVYVEKILNEDTTIEELDMKDGPLAQRAEILSKMIKRYKDITDGEQLNVSGEVTHTHETDLTDEEREQLDELF